MILQTSCNKCGKIIRFHSFAPDRLKLSQLKKFTQLDLKCKKCGCVDKYEINKIYAKFRLIKLISISLMLAYLIMLIVLAPRFWDKVWSLPEMSIVIVASLLLIPFVVFIMINNNIESSQSRFNSSRL